LIFSSFQKERLQKRFFFAPLLKLSLGIERTAKQQITVHMLRPMNRSRRLAGVE